MANIILSEEEYNELKKSRDSWRDRYYEVRYALRKDETLDESISCVRDIPSDVEMIEDLKKRAADSDYYKEKSELLEVKLKNANELADSWKRDYDKRCKEECEKKYRDEISKLQNIVTEKDVEIKGLRKDNRSLTYNREVVKDIIKKNTKLNQTISDQEVTIKALLITIKEMCKED